MKQTSTSRAGLPLKKSLVVFLTILSLMFGKTSSAHNVVFFTPPCFTQGQLAFTVPVTIINAGAGSYYHWQYRATAGAAWTYLSNGNNTINGHVFVFANASQVSAVANFTAPLAISTLTTYTTELNNVELRVLMTDGQDPQTHTVDTWGGDNTLNPTEAKTVRLLAKPGTDNCYSNCTGNILVVNPATSQPPLSEYYGGFEIGTGVGTENFTTPSGTYSTTTYAATDLTQWTGQNTSTTNNLYRVINDADSVNSAFTSFAPHSGHQMLVVNRLASTTNRIWQRTIAVGNASQFYNGALTLKAWFTKLDATVPNMVLEIKGATTRAGTVGTIAGANTTATITGSIGAWSQLTLSFTLPVNKYQKLEISIHSSTSTVASVAIDDLCFLEPAAGLLPLILKPLQGNYAAGVSHLTWGSLQESNTSHFEVERSADGANFLPIGTVAAKGTSDVETNYYFNDIAVAAGINYYRLKLYDKDGNYQYSNIVAINVNIKGTNITSIYPTPFVDKVNVGVSSDVSGQALISLFDNTGKLLTTQQSQISKGANIVTVNNLGNIAKGFYIMKVQIGDLMLTQKLVK